MVAQWANTTFTRPRIDPVSNSLWHSNVQSQQYGLTTYTYRSGLGYAVAGSVAPES